MDIELARTFLAIVERGTLNGAASQLHVTQTAVGARVRTLEQQLGESLFVRNKAGARLTPAGERFVRHARRLVQGWERARLDVSLPPGRLHGLSVGAEASLWHPWLADWLVWMHTACPDVALRVQVETPAALLAQVEEGGLDLALLYQPGVLAGLVTELLLEEQLVMVSTAPDGRFDPARYVHVDWGPVFEASYRAAFADFPKPAVSISLGPLALTYLLSVGGVGYFRAGVVAPLLARGELVLVPDAPVFAHAVYGVYAAQQEAAMLDRARAGLRAVMLAAPAPVMPPLAEQR